jgi:hypothetical protein
MSAKKNFTIEELEKIYAEKRAESDAIEKQLEEMKKEEVDRKKAELKLQKEKRMEEIEAAQKHLNELYKAYIADYGYIKVETKTDDYDWWPSFWRRNFWF